MRLVKSHTFAVRDNNFLLKFEDFLIMHLSKIKVDCFPRNNINVFEDNRPLQQLWLRDYALSSRGYFERPKKQDSRHFGGFLRCN